MTSVALQHSLELCLSPPLAALRLGTGCYSHCVHMCNKNPNMLQGQLQLNNEQNWFLLSTALVQHFLSFPGLVRLYLEPESDPRTCSVEVLQVSTFGQKQILFLFLVSYHPVASIPSTIVLLQLAKAGRVAFLQFARQSLQLRIVLSS